MSIAEMLELAQALEILGLDDITPEMRDICFHWWQRLSPIASGFYFATASHLWYTIRTAMQMKLERFYRRRNRWSDG